ncbi:MAG: DNA recombination protein RmuC [Acidimicrobiia bacterium]
MVTIALIALVIVLAIGAAAGTASLVVQRGRQDQPIGPEPEEVAALIAQRAAQQQQAALGNLIETNRALLDTERLRANEAYAAERSLMEQQLGGVRGELDKMTALVRDFESQRGAKIDALSGALAAQRAGIAELTQTAQGLREALASSKTRGQWGERMAEDVLRLAGFVEGVQYRKQRAVDEGNGIPDFTFLLPQDAILYMDVKFPLDNYLRYVNAESELEATRARDDFLKDVRAKVKELAARRYSDGSPSSIDCVLLFIPNEQLYAFVQEHAGSLLDEAMQRRIVMCSPMTLFAVLAVVRQAVESFRMERTASEILEILGAFTKEWDRFADKLDAVGRTLNSVTKAYDELSGVRTRQLVRQLDRIDDLRRDRALDVTDGGQAALIALDTSAYAG